MAHFMPELHKTLTLTSTHHTCHEKSLQRMWICKTFHRLVVLSYGQAWNREK